MIIKGERDVLHQVMAPTPPTSPLISDLEHLSVSSLSLQDDGEFCSTTSANDSHSEVLLQITLVSHLPSPRVEANQPASSVRNINHPRLLATDYHQALQPTNLAPLSRTPTLLLHLPAVTNNTPAPLRPRSSMFSSMFAVVQGWWGRFTMNLATSRILRPMTIKSLAKSVLDSLMDLGLGLWRSTRLLPPSSDRTRPMSLLSKRVVAGYRLLSCGGFGTSINSWT